MNPEGIQDRILVDYNGFLRGFYWIVSTERGVFEAGIRKRV
jgi:hypothetical protein